MGYTLPIENGFISFSDVDFNCPKCMQSYNWDDYGKRLEKDNRGFIYKICKCCKTLIGITTDMRGDVRVWLKKDESKSIATTKG